MSVKDVDVVEKKMLLPFSPSSSESEEEEREEVVVVEEEEEDEAPTKWRAAAINPNILMDGVNKKRLLSKQLSMRETTREAKWEKRRRQIINRRRMMMMQAVHNVCEEEEVGDGGGEDEEVVVRRRRTRVRSLTDEDLDELRGSIELGFGFNEEDGGYNLCNTLPALDLYFAVKRQSSDPKMKFSPSPVSTPTAASTSSAGGSPSPRSPHHQHSSSSASDNSWMVCNPGDDPQHVKMRIKHWAQAVACSVRQCC